MHGLCDKADNLSVAVVECNGGANLLGIVAAEPQCHPSTSSGMNAPDGDAAAVCERANPMQKA